MDPLAAARKYLLDRHWAVVPVPSASKNPGRKDWNKERYDETTLSRVFANGENVGVLLGEPSGGLVDVDCDCPEAIAAAERFLPPTKAVFGRPSASPAHRIYRAPDLETQRFLDVRGGDGKTASILEVRGTGCQTIFPPSIHPSGERVQWERFGDAAEVDAEELIRLSGVAAAAALLARHWPKEPGARQELALAIAGFVLRRGMEPTLAAEMVGAAAEIAGDEESAKRTQAVRDTAGNLGKKDLTGHPTIVMILGEERAEGIAQRLEEWLELLETPAADAAPVPEEREDWPSPLDEEALYGLAGDVVRTIEPHTEGDRAAVLLQFLAAFGSVVGRGPFFRVGSTDHHTKLFVALVGRTARGRKGTSLDDVLRLFAKVAPDWITDRLVRGGLSSGEGLIWVVRDAVTKWERDKKTRVLEEVVVDPGIDDKRLFVVEAEFANTLKVMSREGNNLSPVIRCAWDAGSLRTMTKNSPARATGAHIAIVGHITVEELRKYLSTTEAAAGFANRFLWVCVRRSKSLPEGGCLEESDLADLERRLEAAVLLARGCGEVGLDEEARADWRTVYGDLSAERTGLFDAVTARAEAQVRRLAVIYAVLDGAEAVRRPHLRAALAIWQYCEASARYIFGDSTGDPIADEILRALRRSAEGLTRSEIHDLFGRNLKAPVINRALGLLLTRGLAAFERKAPERRGGRSTELWTAK